MRVCLITIVAVTLMLPGVASAQVEIESGDIPSEPGTVFSYFAASDSEGVEVEVGPAGADREWDFSDYLYEDIEDDSLIDPEEAPNADDFPEATRVIRTAGGLINFFGNEVHQYQVVSDTAWYMIGSVAVPSEDGPDFRIPINFSENPALLAPLPLEYEAEWDISVGYTYGLETQEEWGEEFAILDSIYISFEMGGFTEVDAWGVVTYTGGEVEVLRQHMLLSAELGGIGVRWFLGQRIVIDLPFEYVLEASHIYRWIAPDVGVIATMTSLPGEEEPEFDLASSVRVMLVEGEGVVNRATEPRFFHLEQNFPNPFNSSTVIGFSLPAPQRVTMIVYNISGQRIDERAVKLYAAGRHEIVFDAQNLPDGVYLYRIVGSEFDRVRKMVYIR